MHVRRCIFFAASDTGKLHRPTKTTFHVDLYPHFGKGKDTIYVCNFLRKYIDTAGEKSQVKKLFPFKDNGHRNLTFSEVLKDDNVI